MKGEINQDWYCSAGFLTNDSKECVREEDNHLCCNEKYCSAFHRKWPTPEQYKEEYGEEYPISGAVWYKRLGTDYWYLNSYGYYKAVVDPTVVVVCTCTPWGKPCNVRSLEC